MHGIGKEIANCSNCGLLLHDIIVYCLNPLHLRRSVQVQEVQI